MATAMALQWRLPRVDSPWQRLAVGCIFLSWMLKCVAGACTAQSPYVGFTADMSMGLHQLRGKITILDDCTFKVENFDMLPGNKVFWWGAQGETLMDMLTGQVVSSKPLVGAYSNYTFNEVTLEDYVTWDTISVLGVWSVETATDYGHIVLPPPVLGNQGSLPAPSVASAGSFFLSSSPSLPESVHSWGPPSFSESSYSSASMYVPSSEVETTPSAASSLSEAPVASPGFDSSEAPVPSMGDGMTRSAASSQPVEDGGMRPPQDVPTGASQPTMFDNCMELSPGRVRVRWTVHVENNSVDVGLEAAVPRNMYVAFGFADPAAVEPKLMGRSDVVVVGYDVDIPFAADYYITDYVECQWQKSPPIGTCPDQILASYNQEGSDQNVTNVQLLYAHYKDGILFSRYQRPIASPDKMYDHDIDLNVGQSYVWAVGPMRPADGKNAATPTEHGSVSGVDYGYGVINLRDSRSGCYGPLNSSSSDGVPRKTARRGGPLIVTCRETKDSRNPPSPDRSLFIDNVETPILEVERGVPVTFSVEAGHDVPLYITSDPVGGRWNSTELVLAGGPEFSGVPTDPYLMTWTPDVWTPSTVYYQSYTGKKMGWQVDVLDRGLPDMYKSNALLSAGRVELFWSVHNDSIAFAARCTLPCGYLAIGIGSGMVKSTAYVGWMEDGIGKVQAYWIDGRHPDNIHLVDEGLLTTRVTRDASFLTFEFERKLRLLKSRNTIDPSTPLKMIWAIGNSWTSGELTHENDHNEMSEKVTIVDLLEGSANIEHLQPVFAVHGFMMFLAWGVLFPGGVMAARYLKAFEDQWFDIHVYAQTAGIAIMFLGLVFAVGEMKRVDLSTSHSKLGLTAISLASWQFLNAWIRPPKPAAGEQGYILRIVWQIVHMYSGRAALVVGGLALVSGLMALDKREGIEYVEDLRWALVGYIGLLLFVVAYNEYKLRRTRQRQKAMEPVPSPWMENERVLSMNREGAAEEEDHISLLQGRWDRTLHGDGHTRSSFGMSEIQLEAMR